MTIYKNREKTKTVYVSRDSEVWVNSSKTMCLFDEVYNEDWIVFVDLCSLITVSVLSEFWKYLFLNCLRLYLLLSKKAALSLQLVFQVLPFGSVCHTFSKEQKILYVLTCKNKTGSKMEQYSKSQRKWKPEIRAEVTDKYTGSYELVIMCPCDCL